MPSFQDLTVTIETDNAHVERFPGFRVFANDYDERCLLYCTPEYRDENAIFVDDQWIPRSEVFSSLVGITSNGLGAIKAGKTDLNIGARFREILQVLLVKAGYERTCIAFEKVSPALRGIPPDGQKEAVALAIRVLDKIREHPLPTLPSS